MISGRTESANKDGMLALHVQPSKLWSIPELVDLVASHCSPSQLATLAQVNRAISDIPLSRLYNKVSSNFHNLLSILAPLEAESDHSLNFVRPLEKSDWIRFLHYAKFVKELLISDTTVSPDAFCVMDATRPPGDVFLSLRRFDAGPSLGSSSYLCRLVFHPKLRVFHATSWKPPLRLLQNIRTIANSLQILELNDYGAILDSRTNAELLLLLVELTAIVQLILPPTFLTSKAFEILSFKEHLQDLRCATSGYFFSARPPFPDFEYDLKFPKTGFQGLTTLCIEDRSARPHERLSITAEHKVLRRLRVTLSGEPELDSVMKWFLEIAPKFTGLTHLAFEGAVWCNDMGLLNPTVSFSMLLPLLSLHQLETLRFETETAVSLIDDHIDQMARAWPSLRNFRFCSLAIYEETYTELTASCLISMAEHCRLLEMLTISLDASRPLSRNNASNIGFSDSFRWLYFPDSLPGEINDTAEFIADLLPPHAVFRYESFILPVDRDPSRMESWAAISALVKSFLRVKHRYRLRGSHSE
ncbi:hypothetical protein SISNIDRAFT_172667 [Sistotremastrum niveocremeum HHB9708]|uniref:F-box domain-containing protein n=1 Tax=Sistotremastrum niveocremeum HHB9708 TaxID=1314777 RepID=A0A164RUQ9_9AGAM|nr:hypothetical protein SISNIDRAFT_172667 [Sistotremastrum niveocremeum HHB9708]